MGWAVGGVGCRWGRWGGVGGVGCRWGRWSGLQVG